ncbi:amidohydrolase family protein [Undibacterium terreum]|uniref:Bifunctional TolB-family protein/amidohydrolase n=1 Tax=Undibacterium terreum TaxID=1224302 RepID=A0A916XKJ5_9BURK|nr:amidohydrolase family protein [Undibacterium terreum]GGC78288.1 bifunctional TolB-family protein/amidohydrolase [Undibacterium terreum]
MRIYPIFRTTLLAAAIGALGTTAMTGFAEETKDVSKVAGKDADKKKWDVNHPPGPASTVNLDTRTGTWMTVDVSPDGKQIVFDLLGDLYLLPIEGGEAKPLTHSIAWEMQARFSPDGKQLVYMSDAGGGDNIWVMNVDGSNPHEVSKENFRLLNNPVWHPNGQYIAARKHYSGTRSLGSGEIWLYHASGGAGVQLNEKPNWQKDLGEPAFSPDGRYVYYSQDTTPGTSFEYNKNSNKQIYQIFRKDLQDGKTKAFVSGPGGAIRPVPSPDGKYLAFVRRVRNQSTLFLKDLKTGIETPAWGELERDMQEAWAVQGVYPAFSWLPDSKEIVVWAKGKIWRVNPFSHAAKEIAFHVKDTREVHNALRVETPVAPDQFDVHQLRWVNVSPQGDKVVYSALGHLYVRDLPNGVPQRLSKQNDHFEFFPQFSRDGKQIVFTTWDDDKLGSVRTMELRSGKETVLTKAPGKYLEPAFSPDGKQVVFVKSRGGYLTTPWYGLEPGVYAVDADGKGAPRLVTEEGSAPQFGKDSDTLYVTRTKHSGEVDWTTSLVRINLDNKPGRTKEEQSVATGEFVSDFALSPDGAWLAYQERFHTYVTPLPLAGKAVTIGPKAEALPVKQLDVNAGDYLHWSGDSSKLHFSLGDELFSSDLKNAFAFMPGAPKELPKPAEAGLKIGFRETASKPTGTTVISGARIVTMKGDEVIDNGRIVIKDNRIVAIGKADDVASPAGAKQIDASGKTIIPGIVDVHWHGGMGEDEIIPQQSWINYASLAFGVTTLHDPSNKTSEIFTQAEMQRAGEVVAPRIFSTGTILYGAKSNMTAVVNSLDDALTHLKRLKAGGAISVKSYNQPRREQRQQILEAARLTGMMVVPEGGSLFETNMTMVVDGHTGVEHAIPVANAYDDVKQLWSQTRVGYTPTLIVGYGGLDGETYWYAHTDVWRHPLLSRYVPRSVLEPRSIRRELAPEEDYNVFKIASTATELQRAGVPVNLGAHGQREGLGAHWEMWTFARGGMTPLEVIRTATLNGAKYLGMDKDIGSLEAGKLADLAIIDADILKDIRQSDKVVQVMLNGRLYDTATMNEVGAKPKARKPFFFEGAGGAAMPVEARGHTHGGNTGEDADLD